MEILGFVLAALAMRTVLAMDLVGAMEFRAIQRDQDAPAEAAHGIQATALRQFGHDIGEHRVKRGGFGGVELGANLAVAGNLPYTERYLAVGPALAGLQMALTGQKERALDPSGNKRIGFR